MALYSLEKLLFKTIYAAKDVECKRAASDLAPVWLIVKKGKPLGKLQSWASPGAFRDSYWLVFVDVYGKEFFAKLDEGNFSLSELKEQGAISVKEQVELEKQKNDEPKDGFDKTKEIVKYALTGVAIWAGVTLLKTFKNGN